MKKLHQVRVTTIVVAFFLFSSVSFSQFDNIDFLRALPGDGAKLLEAYITPWANAFGAGLNGSWYNTAKPHKIGGFDVTFGINTGIVPSSAETFDLSDLNLSSNITPSSGLAPTIAGPDENGPMMTYSVDGVALATFNTPPGTAWKYIPVPTLQVGIGLPMGTELKGRFIPRIPIQEGDIMLWGVGLMHSIMQYIPGNDLVPVDASLFAGYTRINGNVPLSLVPSASVPQNYSTYDPFLDFNDQNMSATVEALNISAIASLNLPVITFYGGLGYSRTRTFIELSGNFPTPVLVPGTTPYAEYNDSGVRTGESFPTIDIPDFSGVRTNIGFRVKLAVVTFHADYTRAQYNVLSTGLGVSFR